nr:PREDICTED: uncharacterized protein LOC105661955 isoform X2 [Megachile rotundata]
MFKKNCRATAVSRIAAFMAGTRYQMLQMRTVQRGSRQYYAMHQLHRSHASEGMSIVGRVVHQIRQRGLDGARLCPDVRRKGGLEHEDVLLSARWLQFGPVVRVQQLHRDRSCVDGPAGGRTNTSWLIRR